LTKASWNILLARSVSLFMLVSGYVVNAIKL